MSRRKKFVLWLNKFYHVQNKITICILYTFIMAVLGVIIYGATHQQASTNMSVTYTRPFYTVNFDTNGGSLTTSTGGGGVTSKQVRLGDPYGDLPIPTKAGYTFIGWHGRNLINLDTIFVNNDNVKLSVIDIDNSVKIENTAYSGGAVRYDCALIPIEDLTDGKYFFSVDNVSYSPNNSYKVVCVAGFMPSVGSIDCGGMIIYYDTAKWSLYADFSTFSQEYSESFLSGRYEIQAYISANKSFDAGYLSFSNLMLAKVSSENEKIGYEPYFIQRDTIFATPSDCTLTAVWSANSNNLLTNGNFEDVYTQTDTGWDNSINGTLHARDWGDYNSGVKNASTAMHAHLKDISSTDPQHGHVFEMIRTQNQYIAASYGLRTTSYSPGTYRLSLSLKGVSGLNRFTGLFFFAKSGTGYDACKDYNEGWCYEVFETTDWFRITTTFHITEISYAHALYLYGAVSYGEEDYPPSPNNIFYLDDVFFEKIK